MKKIISVILLLVILILTTSCGDIEVIRTKLSYDQDLLEISVGDEINITPNCNKEDVVINYSLTSDIVSVDENGNLKALEKGTVIVEASVNKRDSVSAKLVIVVNESKTFTVYYDVFFYSVGFDCIFKVCIFIYVSVKGIIIRYFNIAFIYFAAEFLCFAVFYICRSQRC